MRYEAKTEQDAVEGAAKALGRRAEELKYTVIRDEKAFWGGRVVEIEVEEGAGAGRSAEDVEADEPRVRRSGAPARAPGRRSGRRAAR